MKLLICKEDAVLILYVTKILKCKTFERDVILDVLIYFLTIRFIARLLHNCIINVSFKVSMTSLKTFDDILQL